jgi:hypothetical protein
MGCMVENSGYIIKNDIIYYVAQTCYFLLSIMFVSQNTFLWCSIKKTISFLSRIIVWECDAMWLKLCFAPITILKEFG